MLPSPNKQRQKKQRRDRSGLSPAQIEKTQLPGKTRSRGHPALACLALGATARGTDGRDEANDDKDEEGSHTGTKSKKRGRGRYNTAKKRFKGILDKLSSLPGISNVLAQGFADATKANNPLVELESFIDLSCANGIEMSLTTDEPESGGSGEQPSPLPPPSSIQDPALLTAYYYCLTQLAGVKLQTDFL